MSRKKKRTKSIKKTIKKDNKCSFCEKYCIDAGMSTPCCSMECPYV